MGSVVGAVSACPLCKGEAKHWLGRKDRDVLRCGSCGFLWVPQGLSVLESGMNIYEDPDPIFFREGNEQYYLDGLHEANFRSKLNWLSKFCEPNLTLLDVGANMGQFCSVAESKYRTTGIEVSPAAVELGRKHFHANLHVGSIYELPETTRGAFDIVTLWDVVEHLENTEEALREVGKCLKPNGHLFVSSPDAGSLAARLLGRRWHYVDVDQHLALFSAKLLSDVLRSAGFEVLDVKHFGHHYKIGYVLDRLRQLHGSRKGQKPARPLLPQVIRDISVPIFLGDVMGICARRK